MFKEKQLHRMIEQQNKEQKQRTYQQLAEEIQAEVGEETVLSGRETAVKARKKVIIPALATACVLILTLCLTLGFLLPGRKKPYYRFCDTDDVAEQWSDETIKERAQRTGEPILYFDWYDESVPYASYVMTLKDTGEIVCLREQFIDLRLLSNVDLYISDDRTVLEFMEPHEANCSFTDTMGGIEVKWGGDYRYFNVTFEHLGYKYYLQISMREFTENREEVIGGYISELLSSAA